MDDNRTEFRLSPQAGKITFWICLGIGLMIGIIGLIPIFSAGLQGGAIVLAMPLIGLALIAFGYWSMQRAANDRAPRLIVTNQMIHAPQMAAKEIPWSDVEKVVFVRARPKKPPYMAIDVTGEVGRFEPSRMTKALAKVNAKLGGGEIIVQTQDLDGTHDDIRAAILKVNPNLLVVDK